MSETHSGIDGFGLEAPKVYFPCHQMALQMSKKHSEIDDELTGMRKHRTSSNHKLRPRSLHRLMISKLSSIYALNHNHQEEESSS
jgi:hypothetical protein